MNNTEHTLLATDDAMVWAEEFCRIFDGWVVRQHTWADHDHEINAGGMVTWFANAMQTAVNQYERRKLHEKGEKTETEKFLEEWDTTHPDSEDDLEDAVTLEEQFLEGFQEGRPPT